MPPGLWAAGDMYFQEMGLWLSLSSHILSGQLTQSGAGGKKRFKISESLLSSLKRNHYEWFWEVGNELRTQLCRLNTKKVLNLKRFNDYAGAGKSERVEAPCFAG